jgi:membrane protease YdiL (CAAX protease family)
VDEQQHASRWDTVALLWSIGLLVGLPLALAAGGFTPDEEEALPAILQGLLTFHLPPIIIILVLLHRRVPRGERCQALALVKPERPIRDTLCAALVIFPCVALILISMQLLGVQPEPAPYVRWLRDGSLAIVIMLIVAAVVIAPVTEELLFRRLLNDVLARHLGTHGAMHLTALIFAACHMRPSQIPVLYVVALVLQYLRNSRDSVLSAIFAHAFYNGVMISIGLYVLRVVQG